MRRLFRENIPLAQLVLRIVTGKEDLRTKTARETEEKTKLEIIRNPMDTLKVTAEQVMTALKMPESEQEKYMKLI